jgi:IS30 family transposase
MTKLRESSAEATLEAFARKFHHAPSVRKTLPYDQGKVMMRHKILVRRLKTNALNLKPLPRFSLAKSCTCNPVLHF